MGLFIRNDFVGGAYSKGYNFVAFSRGLIRFRGPQIYQRQYPKSFFRTKYVDLNANLDGIKKEKVGELFTSNISTYEYTYS